MAIKTANLGGTDWVDGDVLYSADQISTFDAVSFHRKEYTNSVAETTSSTSYVDTASTFTLSTPVGALIVGLRFKCGLSIDNVSYWAYARLKINGTNLGTLYLNWGFIDEDGTSANRAKSTDINTGQGNVDLFTNKRTTPANRLFATSVAPGLKLLDTSTTFTVQIKVDNALGTASIDEVEIEVIYVDAFIED